MPHSLRRFGRSDPARTLPLVRPSAERDREPQRGHEVVLELVPASEVAVVEIVLEVEPQRGIAALAQREAEARPGGGAEVGAALVVVERIPAAGDLTSADARWRGRRGSPSPNGCATLST